MDPSMTTFTCDYIEQLINQKYPTQIEKTPPNNGKPVILTPQHENENKKIPTDNKVYKCNDSKAKKVFTTELKTAYTKAAFQQ